MDTLEQIYDIYWEGPYSNEDIFESLKSEKYPLYTIYGTHPIYGQNVLLYIGTTDGHIDRRIYQHSDWIDGEVDECKFYLGRVGKFESWERWSEIEVYDAVSQQLAKQIESLLIFAHQPAYNRQNKHSASSAKRLRIFNTGKRGMLMGEVSGMFHIGHD